MEIRKGDIATIPIIAYEISVLHEKLGHNSFTNYDPQNVSSSLSTMCSRGGEYWTLWDGNEFCGICLGYISPCFYDYSQKIANCVLISVIERYQRTQWTSKLMKQFEEWAKENNADLVAYSCDPKMERTLKRKGYGKIEAKLIKEL